MSLADLSISNPPQSIEDVKVAFGGSACHREASLSLPRQLPLEIVEKELREPPSRTTASSMLKPMCELSFASLIRHSATLAPSLIDVRDKSRLFEIVLSDDERVVVTFERFPPLSGWRISEVSSLLLDRDEAPRKLWTRKRNQKPEQMANLEEIVDALFERKRSRALEDCVGAS